MADAIARRRVLAVVAHPDDEALGAGGTLAGHAAHGDDTYIAFLADGVGARGADRAAVDQRAESAKLAAGILGAREPRFLGFPDNRVDSLSLLDVVKAIEAVIAEIQPDTIYTHHSGDLNVDHALCHRAVMTACRPLPGCPVRRIFAMEVVSSTEWATQGSNIFNPNRFVDISAGRSAKHRALAAYAEEMRPFPHLRSLEAVKALEVWRGASVALPCAEAFMVLRQVE